MVDIIRKLTSRKLWLAIAGVTTGIAIILGANGNDINTIAGGVTSLVSAVIYIIVEGKIDADRVKTAVENTQEAIDVIEVIDNERVK